MAAQPGSTTSALLLADVVARHFVKKYYHILHCSPEFIYKFYQNVNSVSRAQPGSHKGEDPATSPFEIHEKVTVVNYRNFTTELISVDAKDSLTDGVVVIVTGFFCKKFYHKRKFVQTFFLAPQTGGYFLLNDSLRYLDLDESQGSLVEPGVAHESPVPFQSIPELSCPAAKQEQDVCLTSKPEENPIVEEIFTSADQSLKTAMAVQPGSTISALPLAQKVAIQFVKQYYNILHRNPEVIYKVDENGNRVSRPQAGSHGRKDPATSRFEIHKKATGVSYSDFKTELISVDAQDSLSGGVFVIVTGFFCKKFYQKRKFVHTFFLTPQRGGYFLLNDSLRHLDVDESQGNLLERVLAHECPVPFLSEPELSCPPVKQEQDVSLTSKPEENRMVGEIFTSAEQSLKTSMAVQPGSTTSALPLAQKVAIQFVKQYYNILHRNPEIIYKVDENGNRVSRAEAGSHGKKNPATSKFEIHKRATGVNYRDFKAELISVDAQDSLNGGLVVLVTGLLLKKFYQKRKFLQSFFLAPRPSSYFVLNDIFRYLDVDERQGSFVEPVSAHDSPEPFLSEPEPSCPPAKQEEDVSLTSKPDGNPMVEETFTSGEQPQVLQSEDDSNIQDSRSCVKTPPVIDEQINPAAVPLGPGPSTEVTSEEHP